MEKKTEMIRWKYFLGKEWLKDVPYLIPSRWRRRPAYGKTKLWNYRSELRKGKGYGSSMITKWHKTKS
jgi:hypothetical protein